MSKKRIAVIFGGCSPEYAVSLKSATAVICNLDNDKYELIKIGITKDGEWFRYSGDATNIENDTWMNTGEITKAVLTPCKKTHGFIEYTSTGVKIIEVDVVFPVLHGRDGEDGSIQGLLQLSGIPYVGCGVLSSALCMDKELAHSIVSTAGIKTPPSVTLYSTTTLSEMLIKTQHLRFPLFVKPANAGSSFGITKVSSAEKLPSSFNNAFLYDNKVVVEEAIDGFEVGCAVLGNSEPLIVGEIDEIELQSGFFDYNEKYTLETSQIHMPARITAEMSEKIKNTARIIYQALECRGLARVDMFLTPDGEIVFNEVNTIPGFTDHSRYPNMLKGVGLSYSDILDKLIALGEDMYVGKHNTIVINRQNPITEDEAVIQKTLVPLPVAITDGIEIYMEKTAADKLLELFAACEAERQIIAVSGYRTRAEQEAIYNDSLKENGREFTEKYVAYPNTSEHQTGLAVDLALNKPHIDFICPEFPDYGICKKFREMAPDYGFILRYLPDKEAITGISHEPWHFRYVGTPFAREITDKRLCLEEWHEII